MTQLQNPSKTKYDKQRYIQDNMLWPFLGHERALFSFVFIHSILFRLINLRDLKKSYSLY